MNDHLTSYEMEHERLNKEIQVLKEENEHLK